MIDKQSITCIGADCHEVRSLADEHHALHGRYGSEHRAALETVPPDDLSSTGLQRLHASFAVDTIDCGITTGYVQVLAVPCGGGDIALATVRAVAGNGYIRFPDRTAGE